MTTLQRSLALGLFLGAIVGCEPGAPNVTPGPETPHGGALFAMPEGTGFVEITKETTPGKNSLTKILAYFLDSSRKTLATTPTAVSLKPLVGGTPISFKPSGETDPARSGGFVSDPIPDRDDLGGDLTATIDGKTITVPISLR